MIRFRQIKGADSGRQFEFDQALIRIGRMPDSDVDFDPEVDLDASGRHAEIRSESGRYLLVDTGSRNGTWLNGQRIKHAALGPGDEIEFGRGGPKVEIDLVRDARSTPPQSSSKHPGTAKREPRFDPLAMPITTATLLEDLPSVSERLHQEERPSRAGERHRRSVIAWGAAGMLLAAAVAIVAATLLTSVY
jgi:pSer/pThr/pTyr-binding forkhead associated (FHA) protein